MIIVSACLLGLNCRYDGMSRLEKTLLLPELHHRLIPLCPEQLGGLGTPRSPSQIVGGEGTDVIEGRAQVISATGMDVTDFFIRGAEEIVRFMKLMGISTAVMTEKSPSCGVFHIKRNGSLCRGAGVTSALLVKNGMRVISSDRITDEFGLREDRVV